MRHFANGTIHFLHYKISFRCIWFIMDRSGLQVAKITKELFHLSDTYVIDVAEEQNALSALMFVLAIDAEKCSRE